MNILGSHHYSNLAQDYIAAFDSSKIGTYFPLPPDITSTAFKNYLESRVSSLQNEAEQQKRIDIVDAIRSQHTRAGTVSEAVESNLKKLLDTTTIAVVTGQQVGILGGPLYTIYKALHTVLLSEELTKLYPTYRFVPIFWQETEDHDFEEASWVTMLTKDAELRKIRYSPHEDIERRTVGSLRLESESLSTFFDEVVNSLQRTDFTDEIISFFKECYQPGTTFTEAQAKWMGQLLAEDGLLILDPNSDTLKRYASHVFRREIETSPALSDSVNRAGNTLVDDGYHAQLQQQGMNLFITDHGRRYKLQRAGAEFMYNAVVITADELNSIVLSTPSRCSMNVVLRPLVQDTILPTVAYVAGPGETAYFAQLTEAYKWAGILQPPIIPRIGMTILEESVERLLEKHQIAIESLLKEGATIFNNLLKTETEDELKQIFSTTSLHLDAELEALRTIVRATDATLDATLTTTKGKILTTLKDLESKSLASERRKQSSTRQQFTKTLNKLLPFDTLQERELNLLYFLNKYGPTFWDKLKVVLRKRATETTHHYIVTANEIKNA